MSRIICWNARGVGNRRTTTHLKDLIARHHPVILAIIEPKIPNDKLDGLARLLNFPNSAHGGGSNSRIWIFWSSAVTLDDIVWNTYQVTFSCSFNQTSIKCLYTFVHAPCSSSDRQVLWDEISELSRDITVPWIVAGDFNAIASWDEKRGGLQDDNDSIQAFNMFQIRAGLSDIGFHGASFTWSNNQKGDNRIWERLDRVLVNTHGLATLPAIRVDHLTRVIHSDHCPLLILLMDQPPRKAFFRYQKVWESHLGFMPFIEQHWAGELHRNPLVNFGLKLKRLRLLLRDWNWSVFGDLNAKSRLLESQINALESSLQNQWTLETATTLDSYKIELSDTRTHLADMLQAKARVKWLMEGDRNSKVFHAMIKSRTVTGRVRLQRDDGSFSDDRDFIGNKAAGFFADLFSGSSPNFSSEDFSILNKVVVDEDNSRLCAIPEEDEIFDAICSMNKDSAPGPDGFTGHFYFSCWSIIKSDLIKAVRLFFNGHQLPVAFTSTQLTLLPKVSSVSAVSQLRPISLCNFNHKIVSHILMKRLSTLLPRLISEEQVGFVPGRSMHDNIALAHDLVFDLDKKVDGGNVIIKLDMAKAYDRLSWRFLIHVMRAMGFSEGWCDLVYRCISNCFYSVKWDGDVFGFFRSSRGVRQGDPLSPSLFILAMEWFSKALNEAVGKGIVRPFTTLRRTLTVSHLLFADDVLIFTNGSETSIRNLLDLIGHFCDISGEKLNPSKSQIIFPSHFSVLECQNLCTLTGFAKTTLPITYLGAPLYKGRTLISHFQQLISRIKSRLQGWSGRMLSLGGRVELIRSVLTAMGVHSMLTLPVPLSVLDDMISLFAAFLWNNGNEHRRHWLRWEKICTGYEFGGLNIRHPRRMLQSFHAKRAWDVLSSDSLWARFVRSRFRVGYSGSPLWNAISPYIAEVKKYVSWHIGNGNTKGGKIFDMYGISCPPACQRVSIYNILSDDNLRWSFIGAAPSGERDMFRHLTFTSQPDRFVCNLTTDGTFSTKAYHDKLASSGRIKNSWGDLIWRPWIPPKISCFIWKLFHKIVPTDDNIMKISIPLVSKCTCCSNHSTETAQHLFFDGEVAMQLWTTLSGIFDRPRPRGLGSLLTWLRCRKKNFIDQLALGMACVAIWELWKARNSIIHNNSRRSPWVFCIRWAARLIHLITASYTPSTQTDLLLASLHVRPPSVRYYPPEWLRWTPPRDGLALDIAARPCNGEFEACGIIRDHNGIFLSASKFRSPSSEPLHDLLAMLSFFHRASGGHASRIQVIRSSHSSFWKISIPDADSCQRDVSILRCCRNIFANVSFRRWSPSQNHAAITLLSTCPIGDFHNVLSLPVQARRALVSDRIGRPSASIVPPVETRDDSSSPHTHYAYIPFLDDSALPQVAQ